MKLFTKRIFISDLPPKLTEDDLKEKFSKFGSVNSVEIKHRKQVSARNKYPTYAYVTVNIDHSNLQQCFEDFAKYKWKGNFVEIQVAKENFLEKLKQERENDTPVKPDAKEKKTSVKAVLNESVNRKRFHSSDSSNNSEEEISLSKKTKPEPIIQKILEPPKKLDEDIPNETKSSNVNIPANDDVGITDKKTVNEKEKRVSNVSDQKRLHSILEMKKIYQQKKNTIKTALMNVDTKSNNKVIFTDDDYNQDENCYQINSNEEKMKNNRDKRLLFQDEDDDEEDKTFNFDVKEQFQGKKGRKLMELQSKFKNDKRFTMDERFLEDYQISENEEHAIPVELSNEVQEEIEVTAEEKQKELSILEEVLGKKLRKNKDDGVSKKKLSKSLGMVRFDPANPEHSKYVLKQNEPVKEKPKGKREQLVLSTADKEDQRPVVSKETFFEVKESLKDTLEQEKPFSLLSLFSSNKDSVDHETNNEASSIQAENTPKTGDKNPFRYDSSDDNSDNEDHSKHFEGDSEVNKTEEKNNGQNVSLGPTKLWKEPFFFRKDDYRFQEGVDFVRKFALDDASEFKQVRRNIKEIVRAKVRNNLRKNKLFKKKLGGRKMIKVKKAMKNR